MLLIPLSRQYLFVLAVSIQLHLASAGCENFTYIDSTLDSSSDGFSTRFKQKLEVVSCPSSLNRSCQFPLKDYNITVPTRLNVSSHQTFNDYSASSIDLEEDTSYIFNQSSDVPDSESIFKFTADYFVRNRPRGEGLQIIPEPFSTTVSTLNVSVAQPTLNLTVESGYNETLFFIPFMVYTWATFDGCDNETLDGFPIEITTPFFTQFAFNKSNHITVLAGQFIVERDFLIDTIQADPPPKKNAGMALKIDATSMGALMALGVLVMMVL